MRRRAKLTWSARAITRDGLRDTASSPTSASASPTSWMCSGGMPASSPRQVVGVAPVDRHERANHLCGVNGLTRPGLESQATAGQDQLTPSLVQREDEVVVEDACYFHVRFGSEPAHSSQGVTSMMGSPRATTPVVRGTTEVSVMVLITTTIVVVS